MATNDIQQQLNDLTARIEQLEKGLKSAAQSSKSLGDAIGTTSNLIADASKRMVAIGKDASDFAMSIKRQYQAAEKLAEAYKEVSINAGISYTRQREFGKSFIKATELAYRLGGSVEDVKNAYSSLAEESGRARLFSPEEIETVIAIEKSTGLMGSAAAKLVERMDFMGKSTEQIQENIGQIMIDSQKLGLNASKVTKVLNDNFERMQNMSFRGGVKGMGEMAKFAVKMRADVSEMLGMAEKFYEPEAAIEAAANLQMLGGDIADAFGDPFETMYLARNKPEELAKRLQDMTEDMMTFNEETGEYEFPPEVRMQLKSAGEQLGINTESMIDMARQSSKIKDIEMNVSGNITDPEMREGIAGMAKFDSKSKTWKVNLDGEDVDISDIGPEMAKELLAAPTSTDEAIMTTAREAMTTNQYLDQINKANESRFLGEANVYMGFEEAVRPQITEFSEGMNKIVHTTSEAFNKTSINEKIDNMFEKAGLEQGKWVENLLGGINTYLETSLGAIEKIDIENAELDVQNLLFGDKEDLTTNDVQGKGDVTTQKTYDVMSMGGNRVLTGSFGDFSIDDRDLLIAGKPQNILGAGSDNTPVKVEPITLTINGDLSVNMPDGSAEKINMDSIKPQIVEMITNALNGASFNQGKRSGTAMDNYGG